MTSTNNKNERIEKKAASIGKKFIKFLAEHKVEKSEVKKLKKKVYTHTIMGPPYGTYNIPDSEMDNFLDLYNKCLKNGVKMHFTEKSKPIAPLCIDIDFRQESENRKYTETTVKNLIRKIKIVNLFEIC